MRVLTFSFREELFFKTQIVATSQMNAIPEIGMMLGIKKKIRIGIGLGFSGEMQYSVTKENGTSINGKSMKNETMKAVTIPTIAAEKNPLDFSFKLWLLAVRNNLRTESAAMR